MRCMAGASEAFAVIVAAISLLPYAALGDSKLAGRDGPSFPDWAVYDLVVRARALDVWAEYSRGDHGPIVTGVEIVIDEVLQGYFGGTQLTIYSFGGQLDGKATMSPSGPPNYVVGEPVILCLMWWKAPYFDDSRWICGGDETSRLLVRGSTLYSAPRPESGTEQEYWDLAVFLEAAAKQMAWRSPEALFEQADAIVVARAESTSRVERRDGAFRSAPLSDLELRRRHRSYWAQPENERRAPIAHQVTSLQVLQTIRGTQISSTLDIQHPDKLQTIIEGRRGGEQISWSPKPGETHLYLLRLGENQQFELPYGSYGAFEIHDGRVPSLGLSIDEIVNAGGLK